MHRYGLRLTVFRSFSTAKKPATFGNYELVVPSKVYPPLPLLSHIQVPKTSVVPQVQVRSEEALANLRKSCKTAKRVLDFAVSLAKEGVTTNEIDENVHRFCMELGVYPSSYGYGGFPKSLCTSVNNVACHGIPDDRKLVDGDIVNIDIAIYENGYHGDCSQMVLIGNVDQQGVELVEAVRACLAVGIKECKPGCPFHEIGEAIEEEASSRGFVVVPSIIGHGVGEQFHEPPDIYHFGGGPDVGVMVAGNTFTIEPCITQGDGELEIQEDGWTAVTVDGSRTAQEEHTIVVTPTGAEILTS